MDWPVLEGRPTTVETEDGVPLHAEVHGPEDADATVVLLHGYELSQRLWARQVHALLERRPDLRVVTYDHRGHGRSGPTAAERASIHQLGSDLHRVLEQVAPGPAVLAGHSMGGMAIMSFVEQHPHLVGDRVRAVALLGTSAAGMAEIDFGLHPRLAALTHRALPHVRAWALRRVERGRAKPPYPGMRRLLFGTEARRQDVRRTCAALAATPAATAAHFHATFGDHDRTHALAHLAQVPVLVAVGDRDRLTPLAHSRALAQAVPHAELVVYPGCGHMLQLERADDVSRRLATLVATALPTAALPAG